MQARTLLHCSHTLQDHNHPRFLSRSLISFNKRPLSLVSPNSHSSLLHLVIKPRSRLLAPCNSPAHESANSSVTENESSTDSISEFIEETGIEVNREGLGNQSMWEQMKEIVMFTGPATGLWICGPLMSLIDTAVIGQGSSIELAALAGPGTVLCDGMSYIFMFLSIATSNMVATSLAKQARTMLKSLAIIGTILGLALGIIGTAVPWFFPGIFTHDQKIIQEVSASDASLYAHHMSMQMHRVLIPYFLALAVTPCILSLEGTLLAGRDLKFISLAMSGCFFTGALLLLLVSSSGYGLPGYWFALVGFQWGRLFLALQRLLSPDGILFSEDLSQLELKELKAT
ncbi:hypothetical protein POTOM_033422 [Populus tomentosa]|uniref:Uncharacterized protein n=1 Tax=Populus tomentosa TaxID=118781 RepID=A0A8X7ZGG2_POPTO|nr:hypothetical protein POTOM_033422 [Populus tomentosa]